MQACLQIVNERSRVSHKANIAYYAMSLFKEGEYKQMIFTIYIPPIEEDIA